MVVFSLSAPPILAFVEAEFCTKLFSWLHGKAPKHEHVRHGGIVVLSARLWNTGWLCV